MARATPGSKRVSLIISSESHGNPTRQGALVIIPILDTRNLKHKGVGSSSVVKWPFWGLNPSSLTPGYALNCYTVLNKVWGRNHNQGLLHPSDFPPSLWRLFMPMYSLFLFSPPSHDSVALPLYDPKEKIIFKKFLKKVKGVSWNLLILGDPGSFNNLSVLWDTKDPCYQAFPPMGKQLLLSSFLSFHLSSGRVVAFEFP